MAITDGAIYSDGSYLEKNPTWHVEHSSWKANQIAKILADNKVDPKSIVDIGCGAGQVLVDLHRVWPNATLTGWEVSTDVADTWRSIPDGIDLKLGDFRTDPNTYDVALMIDVFEHVPDYMGLLQDSRSIANKYVFHIPLEMNVSAILRKNYLNSRTDVGHLHYFSAESALAVLNDSGYTVIDWRFARFALEVPVAQTRSTKVMNVARRGLEIIGTKHSAMLLGGYQLLVLATPTPT